YFTGMSFAVPSSLLCFLFSFEIAARFGRRHARRLLIVNFLNRFQAAWLLNLCLMLAWAIQPCGAGEAEGAGEPKKEPEAAPAQAARPDAQSKAKAKDADIDITVVATK